MSNENQQKHAGGRPKSENPLSIDCKCRFTQEQYSKLQRYCKRHKMRTAQAIRQAVLDALEADEQQRNGAK